MLLSHPTRRLRGRVAAALLVACAATAATVMPASADPAPVASPISGTFTTKAGAVDTTGAIFQGTWDALTGDIGGKFIFPVATVDVTDPLPATIELQLSQPADGVGVVDFATNQATFSADLELALLSVTTDSGTGGIDPCRYSMTADLTGPFDPATGIVNLAGTGLTFTHISDPGRCVWRLLFSDISGVIDGQLENSLNAFDATFDLGRQDAEPPPPPPPPPPSYGGCQATVSDATPAGGQAITVTGTGADTATVTATINGATVGSGAASSDGAFSFTATVPQVTGAVTMAVDCGTGVANVSLTVGGGGNLPRTGSSTLPMTAVALVTIVMGGVALTAGKLRRAKLENA